MMSRSSCASCAMLPVILLLTACGGAGTPVDSTPTPPTSPGSGPATPARNTTLPPTISESFANTAASATATAGQATGLVSDRGVAAANVTLAYDATAKSYTFTGAGRTQSFDATNRLSADSTSSTTVYEKKAGDTTERLVLFNAGSGNPVLALTYGSYGSYQRSVDNGGSLDLTRLYFVYGVQTAASDMPRSGRAGYTTTIDGSFFGDQAATLGGNGTFTADFAAGKVEMSLTPTARSISTGATTALGTLAGSGSIAGGGSTFASSLAGGGYTGSAQGMFFGPSAAEMGATFTFASANNAATAVGAMVGKKASGTPAPTPAPTPPPPPTNGMLPPTVSESFANRATSMSATVSSAVATPSLWQAAPLAGMTFAYDAATQTYSIAGGGGTSQSFGAADRSAALSTGIANVYEKRGAGITETLTLFNAGAANPTLALTYASYGLYQRTDDAGGGSPVNLNYLAFVYGVQTAAADMPRTGSASYNAVIDGYFVGGDASQPATLSGSGRFDANFASGTIGVTMSPTARSITSGAVTSLPTLTGSGTIAAGTATFATSLSGGAYQGTLQGMFFGPQAAEIGASFAFGRTILGVGGLPDRQETAVGAMVGKRN